MTMTFVVIFLLSSRGAFEWLTLHLPNFQFSRIFFFWVMLGLWENIKSFNSGEHSQSKILAVLCYRLLSRMLSSSAITIRSSFSIWCTTVSCAVFLFAAVFSRWHSCVMTFSTCTCLRLMWYLWVKLFDHW